MTFIHDRRAAGKRLHYAWFHHIEYYNQHGLFITRSVCLICFVQVLATAALLQLLTGGRPSRPASWLWRAAAPPLTIAILYDWCGCVPTRSLTNRDKTTEISEREREREKICTRLKQRFFFQIFMIHRCVWMFPSSFPFGYYHSHFSYWFFLIITTWMGWWRRRNAESVMKCNANPSRLGPETNGMPGHLNGKWAPARAPSRAPEPPSLSLSDTWLYAFEMHSTFHSNLLLL